MGKFVGFVARQNDLDGYFLGQTTRRKRNRKAIAIPAKRFSPIIVLNKRWQALQQFNAGRVVFVNYVAPKKKENIPCIIKRAKPAGVYNGIGYLFVNAPNGIF
jgi:hypothetical protein